MAASVNVSPEGAWVLQDVGSPGAGAGFEAGESSPKGLQQRSEGATRSGLVLE